MHAGPNCAGHFDCWVHRTNVPPPFVNVVPACFLMFCVQMCHDQLGISLCISQCYPSDAPLLMHAPLILSFWTRRWVAGVGLTMPERFKKEEEMTKEERVEMRKVREEVRRIKEVTSSSAGSKAVAMAAAKAARVTPSAPASGRCAISSGRCNISRSRTIARSGSSSSSS
eukprot:110306-Pleurochrysis_carterae.AAC.1